MSLLGIEGITSSGYVWNPQFYVITLILSKTEASRKDN